MKSNHKIDYLFKLLILGESGVGKTCLLLRYVDDFFTANHLTTIGIDFKIKIIQLKNKLIKLQIWDTAGQERFRNIGKMFYKGAHGIILTYDVTDENSFKNIRNWIKQIEENAPTNVCKILVGNKCDKPDRKITKSQGQNLAEDYNMSFFETSAKTRQNINEVFNFLTEEILKTDKEKTQTKGDKLPKEESSKKENNDKTKIIDDKTQIVDDKTKIIVDNKNISLLIKENEEYKNEISNLKNYIKELERKLKEKENIINEEKIENEKLINKIKFFENNSNNYSLSDRILELDKELNKFKSYCLSPGQKLISIKFISTDQMINNYTIIAKNDDKFSKIEDILYEQYPNYKESDNYFILKGNKIKRNKTLEENNINDNDIIMLSINDLD